MSPDPQATPEVTPTGTSHTHPLLSVALGALMLFFFVDGFVRGATPSAGIVLLALGCFVVIGLIDVATNSRARRIEPRAVLFTVAATLLVAVLDRSVGMSAVFAAALVGVIAGLLPRVIPLMKASDSACLYVGAFAGMTSPVVVMGPGWLILVGVLAGCIWSLVRDAWVGVGGKMGTMAFAGVAITTGIATMLGHQEGMVPLPKYLPAQEVIVVVVSVVAAQLTYWLVASRGWGIVMASALPTLIATALFVSISHATTLSADSLSAAWFGASFVGLTSATRLADRRWMMPAMAVVFGVLLILFEANLSGLGGDLGATASAAVIAVLGMGWLARRGSASSTDPTAIPVRHLGH